MRALVVMLLIGVICLPAIPQCISECVCKDDMFRSEVNEFTFGIPKEIFEHIRSLLRTLKDVKLPLIGILIPDVTITLGHTFSGRATAICIEHFCCPSREKLAMNAYLQLRSETVLNSVPPASLGFSSVIQIPEVTDVVDNSPEDENDLQCRIRKAWTYELNRISVSFNFSAYGIPIGEIPIVESGVGIPTVYVAAGCVGPGEEPNIAPVFLSWPRELQVPLGGAVEFQVQGFDLDGDPLVYQGHSSQEGVLVSIEGSEGPYPGRGRIRVLPGASVQAGDIEEVAIYVCDPWGTCDGKTISVTYTANHPPEAISGSMLIRPDEGCHAGVIYRASRVPACLCLFPWRCP
jgi:hypothetical protein